MGLFQSWFVILQCAVKSRGEVGGFKNLKRVKVRVGIVFLVNERVRIVG
jgi:hypothetical protein